MTIIQISDIHIGAPGEDTREIDVRGNFRKVFAHSLSRHPDLIVISGDLCYRSPLQEIYHWVTSEIDHASCPIYIIPGNHDDVSMIPEIFLPARTDSTGQRYFHLESSQKDILFLDTTSATMSEEQWAWLSQKLRATDKPIIFMHHPPILCNIPFMDGNHAFKEIDRFEATIATANIAHVHIFAGHYHIQKSVHAEKYSVHVAPSTIFQIRQDTPHFEIDHFNIGYRIIDISNKRIGHRVMWV